MPKYTLENGKTIETEQEVPEEELDDFLSELNSTEGAAEIPIQAESASPEPGLASQAWDAINKPLIEAPARLGKEFADRVAPADADDTERSAYWKGLGSGMVEGLGNVVSSLTSPLELGMAAATGGASFAAKKGLTSAAKGLSAVGAGLSGLESAHGVGEVVGGAREGNLARVGMGLVEGVGGLAGVKQNYGTYNPKPSINLAPNPSPRAVSRPAEIVPEKIPEPISEPIPEQSNLDLDTIDSTVDSMVDEALANQPKPQSPKSESGKPKLKMRINRETNTLEPDFDDPATFAVIEAATNNKSVPESHRVDPDSEIEIPSLEEVTALDKAQAEAMANAIQPDLIRPAFKPTDEFAPTTPGPASRGNELATARQGMLNVQDFNPTTLGPFDKGKSIQLGRASQGELSDFRQPSPDVMIPGGRQIEAVPMSKTQQWLGLPRAIQSAWDLSFPLRQGLGLIHTKGWWKAWPDMMKSFGDEGAYKGVMDSIAERPNFRGKVIKRKDGSPQLGLDGKPLVEESLAQKAGLAITDMVSNREEAFASDIANKIPGIRASNRAYTAFANKLRADTFDNLIKNNPEARTNIVLAKQLANYVNNASGRGNLGVFEDSAQTLNNALFSPRLMASRLQMVNPKNYFGVSKPVRQQYVKSLLALGGTWGTMAGLAKGAGAEVSMDMESSDFGKIKIGNTRLDPAGGFQQYIVLATRLAKMMNSDRYTGKAFAPTPGSDIWNFVENKFAPNAKMIAGPMLADKHRPFEVGDQALRMFTPIFIQDLSEILQQDASKAWTLAPGIVGIGSNTYESGQPNPTLIPRSMGWKRERDWSIYPGKSE